MSWGDVIVLQVVNCEQEDVGENVFKVRYTKSRRQKGQRSHTVVELYRHGSTFAIGKRVFKKPVKFLIKFVPTETAGEGGDSDQNDGRNFIVTFVHTGGELGRERDSPSLPPSLPLLQGLLAGSTESVTSYSRPSLTLRPLTL